MTSQTVDKAASYKVKVFKLADGSEIQAIALVDLSGTPVTSGGDASAANQVITNTEIGIVTETAPTTDTASSGLNGRLQRIAQRLTTIIAGLAVTGTHAIGAAYSGAKGLMVGGYDSDGATWNPLPLSSAGQSVIISALGSLTVQGTGGTPYTFGSLKTTVQTVYGVGNTRIKGYYIFNPDSSTTYLQMFNTTSSVTLGTTVPTLSIAIPAGQAANLVDMAGIVFATGLKIAATTTRTGNTAPTTGLDVNIWYGAG